MLASGPNVPPVSHCGLPSTSGCNGLVEAADIEAEQGALGPVPAEVNTDGQG